MILPFSQKFKDGSSTHFVEKIWSCIVNDLKPITSEDSANEADLNIMRERAKYNLNIYEASKLAPKRHSIREDAKNRWWARRMIHPVINNRSKDQFQFAPTLPCISIQIVAIRYTKIDDEYSKRQVYVDGRELFGSEIIQLAENDGFKSVNDFFSWFDHDFTGKIIHWTNLKY